MMGMSWEQPEGVTSSAGQWFQLPTAVSQDLKATFRACWQAGMQVVATLPSAVDLLGE